MSLPDSINGTTPIHPCFLKVDPNKTISNLLVPPKIHSLHTLDLHTYHIISQDVANPIPNSIIRTDTSLFYNVIQKVINEDNGLVVIGPPLHLRSPHLGGRSDDIKNQIYDITIIYSAYLASFVNISAILQKKSSSINILLHQILFLRKLYPRL